MLVITIIIFVCHSFLNVVSILLCTSHYDRWRLTAGLMYQKGIREVQMQTVQDVIN